MNSEISDIILEIKKKFIQQKVIFSENVNSLNREFEEKINFNKEIIHSKENEISELKLENERLQNEIHNLSSQLEDLKITSMKSFNNNDQIDELVREIDVCIKKLKK